MATATYTGLWPERTSGKARTMQSSAAKSLTVGDAKALCDLWVLLVDFETGFPIIQPGDGWTT